MATEQPPGNTALRDDEDDESAGKHKFSISADRDLVRRVDAQAKRLGISRSALFSIAASMFMDDLLRRRE